MFLKRMLSIFFILIFIIVLFFSQHKRSQNKLKQEAQIYIPNKQIVINGREIDRGGSSIDFNEERSRFVQYLEDDLTLISQDEPYKVLVLSIARDKTKPRAFEQSTRLYFFDGKSWAVNKTVGESSDSKVSFDSIIKEWRPLVNQYYVDLNGKLSNNLEITATSLSNSVGINSTPGYLKFFSQGKGILKIGKTGYKVHVLYTRISALESSKLQFFITPPNLLTDWLVFWDENGNFYHLDSTFVEKPSSKYISHELGFEEKVDKTVLKSFSFKIDRDSNIPPQKYTFNVDGEINSKLDLKAQNYTPKISSSYKWFMGIVKGQITNKSGSAGGVGIIEYIKN